MAGGFEHHFRRTIPGDIESVRRRLSDVLESFGYIVLGDAPIQAKRPRQKSIWVAMVLDYDTTLTIALKPISSASTLATFDYDIEQLFTKGEMQALEREAEAIIALATSALQWRCSVPPVASRTRAMRDSAGGVESLPREASFRRNSR